MIQENNYKKDFPLFESNPDLVYLDNAATFQRPRVVIDTLRNFMENENANLGRGIFDLSQEAMKKFSETRKKFAKFISAEENEIVFTRNSTEAFNLLAYTIKPLLKPLIDQGKNEIVLTEMEHHSNLVPWQELAKRENLKLKFIKIDDNFELDLEDAKSKITDKTALVSTTHISNVLGTINPIKEIIKLAKQNNAISVIDAAQSASNTRINVKDLDCDFLAFSAHKIFGPTGVGILYGKYNLLEKLNPFNFGGGMIESASLEKSTFINPPGKFEAGTQNIAEVVASGEAINYLEKIGFDKLKEIESSLVEYILKRLNEIQGTKIYNPGVEKSSGIVSFNLEGVHPHDVASLLNEKNIAIRAGHHCCMPLIKIIEPELNGVCRASFSIFNTKDDIDRLVEALKEIKEKFE